MASSSAHSREATHERSLVLTRSPYPSSGKLHWTLARWGRDHGSSWHMFHSFRGSKPQTLMFSATVPQFVKQAAQKYLSKDVLLIDLIGDGNVQSATTINQMALQCENANREVLRNLIKKYCPGGKTIVFCETKRECDRVAHFLTGGRTLHGDVSQNWRNDIIRSYKSRKLNILVTTDVAARGLDIPNVDLMIQTSPPNDKDNFIHRTGRTGRAGNTGNAIMLYKRENAYEVGLCEKIAKTKLIRIQAPTLDLQTVINS